MPSLSTPTASDVYAHLRQQDYERYLLLLLLPAGWHSLALPLGSLHSEIRRISHITREEMPALIRLQWWRDALEELWHTGQGSHRHPVLALLQQARQQHPTCPLEPLLALLDAHEQDVSPLPPDTMPQLMDYHSADGMALYQPLEFCFSNPTQTQNLPPLALQQVLRQTLQFYGILRQCHALPYDLPRGKLWLPTTLLEARQQTAENILQQPETQDWRSLLAPILQEASHLRKQVQQQLSIIPSPWRRICRPLLSLGDWHHQQLANVQDWSQYLNLPTKPGVSTLCRMGLGRLLP